MTRHDGEHTFPRRVAGTLLAWLFFVMDGIIGFMAVQRNGEAAGDATQQTGTAEGPGAARSTAPGRKLATGTAVIGVIGGFSWMIVVSWLLPNHPIVSNIALWGGLVCGLGIWAGLVLRAKHTGKFD